MVYYTHRKKRRSSMGPAGAKPPHFLQEVHLYKTIYNNMLQQLTLVFLVIAISAYARQIWDSYKGHKKLKNKSDARDS